MNEKLNLCRICLQSGAKLPIFEDSDSESSIFSKLNFCLNKQIEDIEGYPRHICKECNDTLDTVCSFISRYRDTCSVLESDWHFVKEETDLNQNHAQSDVETGVGDIKNEPDSDHYYISDHEEDSMPLLKLKFKRKVKKELPKKKRCNNRIKDKSKKNDISRIASSILEGDFAWIGDVWCIKSTKPKLPEKAHTPVQRQKEIKIKQPKRKVPQPPPQRLCDLCGQVFKCQDKLSLHKRKVHFKNPMKCPKCPRLLASEYYLNRHMKRKHDTEAKSFICTVCGRGFAFKGELSSHNRNVHDKHLKPKKLFTCKICNKTYKCAKSVIVHERSAHTGQRPAVCSVCGTSFYHEDYLKEHMRLHTGETPFKCPICGRGYAQRGNMKSHLRIHKISEVDATILSKLRPNYLKLLKG